MEHDKENNDIGAIVGCLLYTLIAGSIMFWGYRATWISLNKIWDAIKDSL